VFVREFACAGLRAQGVERRGLWCLTGLAQGIARTVVYTDRNDRVADGIAVFEALAAAGMLFVIAGVRSPQYLA
jgi:hypothetical protein